MATKNLKSKVTESTNRPEKIETNNGLKNIELSNAYTQAWNEFNVRITARHHLITAYITISTLLLGVLISSDTKDALKIFAYFGIPSMAFIFSLLLFIHDKSMNNLISYMVYLETRNTNFPSYHATTIKDIKDENWGYLKFFYRLWQKLCYKNLEGWGRQKLVYRLWQSICIMAMILMFATVSFYVGFCSKKVTGIETWFPVTAYCGIVLASILLKFFSIRGRKKACRSDDTYQNARQAAGENDFPYPK